MRFIMIYTINLVDIGFDKKKTPLFPKLDHTYSTCLLIEILYFHSIYKKKKNQYQTNYSRTYFSFMRIHEENTHIFVSYYYPFLSSPACRLIEQYFYTTSYWFSFFSKLLTKQEETINFHFLLFVMFACFYGIVKRLFKNFFFSAYFSSSISSAKTKSRFMTVLNNI